MSAGFSVEAASIDGSAHLLVEIAGLLYEGRLDRDIGTMAALIERNAAEFTRMRDLLVSIEPAVTQAKDGTIWESKYRERYDVAHLDRSREALR